MARRLWLKSADGVAAWKTAFSSLVLARWGVLFSEARELIWLVPTEVFAVFSYRLLHWDFQNVPREHPNCTARTVLANSSADRSASSYVVSGWCRNSPRRVIWLLAISHVFLRNLWRVSDYRGRITPACYVACKRQVCHVFTCFDKATETCGIVLLRSVINVCNIWEVSMEGSHTNYKLLQNGTESFFFIYFVSGNSALYFNGII
jgi:hypothetical protein